MTNHTWTEIPAVALDRVAGGFNKLQVAELQALVKDKDLKSFETHLMVARDAIGRGIQIGERAMKDAVLGVVNNQNSWQGYVHQNNR